MGESGRPNFHELLKNDIFVDFLNTFLSLPVFGQIPIYIFKDRQWDLQPELPSDMRSDVTGFLKWLEEYRLPHFLQTDLYLHFVLCELLLGAEIPEISGVCSLKT
ncbi:regulator of G-protein signaling protein-like [Scyliorhinus canicula]|uniref:regulator of G-protein signaling protein-like n=1 Tax=Scyliorhinus canicula TaxID=7830 RepID=UPI0018F37A2D|nr:regulator of G-protein signaling protein-like [Scyliorhinus canicula]